MTFTVLWENEHVRVLRYTVEPGMPPEPSDHPDSVVVALGDAAASWLPAQQRATLDVADAIVVELKGSQHEAPQQSESPFDLSDTQLRALFGDAIVDGETLIAEDPEATRWDDEVSYTSPLERYRGWVATASVGVNVRTGVWAFVCDTDMSDHCIHTYSLTLAALGDERFGRLIQKALE